MVNFSAAVCLLALRKLKEKRHQAIVGMPHFRGPSSLKQI
jgi:hypothetical protein